MPKLCFIGQSLIEGSDLKEFPQAKQQNSPWYHWSVYVNETVYEVNGQSNMEVVEYKSNEETYMKNNRVLARVLLNETSIVDEQQIQEYIKKWIQRNPTYWLVYSNCQDFANEFAENFFGVVLETQMNKYLKISSFLMSAGHTVTIFVTIFAIITSITIIILLVIYFFAYAFKFYGIRVAQHPHLA